MKIQNFKMLHIKVGQALPVRKTQHLQSARPYR